MIKIFLESDKFSHKAGVTKHATNSLARKSHIIPVTVFLMFSSLGGYEDFSALYPFLRTQTIMYMPQVGRNQ